MSNIASFNRTGIHGFETAMCNIEGKPVVTFRVGDIEPELRTILEVAEAFRLSSRIVLNYILLFNPNVKVVEDLFRHVRELSILPSSVPDGSVQDIGVMRRWLRNSSGAEGLLWHQQPPYYGWKIHEDLYLTLPISFDFYRLLDARTQQRFREEGVVFYAAEDSPLRQYLSDLRRRALSLKNDLDAREKGIEERLDQLATLSWLEGLIEVQPDGEGGNKSEGMEGLRGDLEQLREAAIRALVLHPPRSEYDKARWNKLGIELLLMVESEQFVDAINELIELHRERSLRGTEELLRETRETLGVCETVLFRAADILPEKTIMHVIQQHVHPMIDVCVNGKRKSKQRFKSALTASVAGVSYSEDALALVEDVVVLQVIVHAAPTLAHLAQASGEGDLAELKGKLLGLLEVLGGLEDDALEVVKAQVEDGDLQGALKSVIEDANVAGAEVVQGLSVLVGLAVLINTFIGEDSDTEERLIAALKAPGLLKDAMDLLPKQHLRHMRHGLGVFAGVVSVGFGIAEVREATRIGDDAAAGLGIAVSVGGAVKVAGLLMTIGALKSATIIGAPVGITLMKVGGVIAGTAKIVQVLREATMPRSKIKFGDYLSDFSREGGLYDRYVKYRVEEHCDEKWQKAHTERAVALQNAFEELRSNHHDADFQIVTGIETDKKLRAFGIPDEDVRFIMGYDRPIKEHLPAHSTLPTRDEIVNQPEE